MVGPHGPRRCRYRVTTARSRGSAIAIALTAGAALLSAGVIASAVTIAFAAATGYSDRPAVVLTEVILATSVVVSVLSLAWWLLTYICTGTQRRLLA
jgi:4-amino-4-deoxy-L-arabinose transferase-like glycosyltransferase